MAINRKKITMDGNEAAAYVEGWQWLLEEYRQHSSCP